MLFKMKRSHFDLHYVACHDKFVAKFTNPLHKSISVVRSSLTRIKTRQKKSGMFDAKKCTVLLSGDS